MPRAVVAIEPALASRLITTTVIEVAKDGELSSIWNRGIADPDELSAEEFERFNLLIIAYLHQNEAQYFAQQHGFHDAGVWTAKLYELRTWISTPGINRVWTDYKRNLSPDFISLVDGLLASS